MSQVVLITGCSSGIGRAVAERLTAAGQTVVATARRLDSLDGVAATTRLALDVMDSSAVECAVAATLQQHGRIDVLANPASPYRALYATTERVSASMHKRRVGPDAVARVVQRAIEDRAPRARYVAGLTISGALVLHLRDYLLGSGVEEVVRLRTDEARDTVDELAGPFSHLIRRVALRMLPSESSPVK